MKRWLMLIVLGLPITVMANSVVIATLGKTVSITPFLKTVATGIHTPKQPLSKRQALARLYTVHSSGLTVGTVKKHAIVTSNKAKGLLQPIFLLGTDNVSRHWLATYCTRLNAVHAKGLVVESTGVAAFFALHKTCAISLEPMQAGGIAAHFGIKHYPVLITQHLVEQ